MIVIIVTIVTGMGCWRTIDDNVAIETIHDFGTLRQHALMEHTFTVKNRGDSPLRIMGTTTSCGCTVVDVGEGTEISALGTLDVPVKLNLRGKKAGPISMTVALKTQDEENPIILTLKGNVFEEHPQEIKFEKVLRGARHEKRFTLRQYPGQPPIEVQNARLNERLLSVTYGDSDSRSGIVEVVTELKPDIPFGQFESNIVLTTNDKEAPEKIIRVTGYVMRPLEVEPAEVLLGVLRPGKTLSSTVELASPYGNPVTLVDIENSRPEFLACKLEPSATDTRKRFSLTTIDKAIEYVPAGVVKTELWFRAASEGTEYRERVEVYALKE